MSDVNTLVLTGRLTRDPEQVNTPNGHTLCKFGMACNRNAGKDKEFTTFVDVQAWGPMAENMAKHLAKGRRVLIQGRLDFDSWEDQTGAKRSKLYVTADDFSFLDSPKATNEN